MAPKVKCLKKTGGFSIFLGLLLFVFFQAFFFGLARYSHAAPLAVQKDYYYDTIKTTIYINKDSTFDVEEEQAYFFQGSYHEAWRSIPKNKIDAISDIEVADGQTGMTLVFSPEKLEKNNPSSWGRYTYYEEAGIFNIIWYYDATDMSRTWTVKYTVHGGIIFGPKDGSDRLYWNIFTNYDKSVKKAEADVYLPAGTDPEKVKIASYRNSEKNPTTQFFDEEKYIFISNNFVAGEMFTVDISWPSGIVDRYAYWKYFLAHYLGYIMSVIIILITAISLLSYWYFTEVHHKGRGVIVPQYEPPQNLKPAMAEVILKEGISDAAWPATAIDLAVRGYLKIKEDISGTWRDLLGESFYKIFFSKDYIVEMARPYKNDPSLEDYEKMFLDALFAYGQKDYFSTKELRKKGEGAQRVFQKSLEKVKDKLLQETDIDTQAYDVGPAQEKRKGIIMTVVMLATIIFFQFEGMALGQNTIFLISVILCLTTVFAYIKYEARLSKKGYELKEGWLGFKIFMQYYGRYRYERKITPDLFEKYLPYAIIFGVEKKWGASFDSFSTEIKSPAWYGSGSAFGVGGSGFMQSSGAGSFSAATFSASFTSSFSSSFTSSSGGRGGAGGGSAGGGGGGGGGGAS